MLALGMGDDPRQRAGSGDLDMTTSRAALPAEDGLSLREALTAMPRADHARWDATAPLIRWLIMIRAPVLVMTFSSAAGAGLLATFEARAPGNLSPDFALLCLTVLGLLLAHATNNLLNDATDSKRGLDKGNYFRNRYGVHALEQGLISERGFRRTLLLTGAAAGLVALALLSLKGPALLWALLPGAVCLLFYTWPMKQWGLGEGAVFWVWGPLMVLGTQYTITDGVTLGGVYLSLLLGLGPSIVIFGKHIDKADLDEAKGMHTLPVRLGEAGSRAVLRGLVLAQFPLLLLGCGLGHLPWPCLLAGLSAPSAWRLFQHAMHPRPATRPDGVSKAQWPLWFVAYGFDHTRRFGPLLLLGLLLGAVL